VTLQSAGIVRSRKRAKGGVASSAASAGRPDPGIDEERPGVGRPMVYERWNDLTAGPEARAPAPLHPVGHDQQGRSEAPALAAHRRAHRRHLGRRHGRRCRVVDPPPCRARSARLWPGVLPEAEPESVNRGADRDLGWSARGPVALHRERTALLSTTIINAWA
jgi:hypothetical protein